MSTLLVWREQIQTIYTKYSIYVGKALQFLLGFCVFHLINSNVGFMKTAASSVVTLGLAVVCMFLPLMVMVVAASGLILIHFYSVSLPIAIVTAAIFLIMYIFYFRFTPGKAWLVLLTPVAIAFKVPFLIPIAFGLTGTTIYAIPVICGTIVFYMTNYVKSSSAALKGNDVNGMLEALLSFTKNALANKEMWVMVGAMTVSLILVYVIRTKSIDHAWKIASIAGAVAATVSGVVGNVMLDLKLPYGVMVGSALGAILLGMLLEFLLFSVDYARTEWVQFEDDEYYYYVKAVPKTGVSAPKVSVKHINERMEQPVSSEPRKSGGEMVKRAPVDETGVLSSTEVNEAILARKRARRQDLLPKRKEQVQQENRLKAADDILLTQSLTRELGLGSADLDKN